MSALARANFEKLNGLRSISTIRSFVLRQNKPRPRLRGPYLSMEKWNVGCGNNKLALRKDALGYLTTTVNPWAHNCEVGARRATVQDCLVCFSMISAGPRSGT